MKSSRYALAFLPLLSLSLFLLILRWATKVYSGGTRNNFDAIGYNFSENYISDLGRYTALNGTSNLNTMLLFLSAFIILGISFSCFFYKKYQFIETNYSPSKLLKLGTLFSLCASICIIGLALNPSDINIAYHLLFEDWIFRFFFIAFLLFSFAYWNIHTKTKLLAIAYLILSIAIAIYILFFDFNLIQKMFTDTLILKVIAQKLIVLTLIIGFIIITFANIRLIKATSSSFTKRA